MKNIGLGNADMMKNNLCFQIGSFCFRLLYPQGIALPQNLTMFQSFAAPTYTYEIELAERLPLPTGKLIAARRDLAVFQTENGEERLIGITGIPEPYALYRETGPANAKVTVLSCYADELCIDTIFNSLLATERRLVPMGYAVLHCAYIANDGEAILFSAPSETGKTTQANLWEKYRGSRTVNGDRALLQNINGQWFACGWPVCGSSGVCANEAMPIKAIVMLSQAKENHAERMTPSRAFMLLYGQITVNGWNAEACDKAIDTLENLVNTVPIFHLGCTISREAVEHLHKELYGS